MKLEELQAVLRPRTAFEAMDLGLRLLQRWWGRVMLPWLAVVVPVWVVVWAALGKWAPVLAMLLLWWLRPVFEKVVLHVLSRGLFGALPTVKQVLRELPKLYGRGLFHALFVHRLDPTRPFTAPVSQLEGLRGAHANRRRAQIRRQGTPAAMFALVLSLALEFTIFVGLITAVLLFLPDRPQFRELLWEDVLALRFPLWLRIALPVCMGTAYALVAPIQVAWGFGLYINRRTLLEGWDVEIQFRQLAGRLARVGGAVLLSFGLWSGVSRAQEPQDPGLFSEQALDQLMDELRGAEDPEERIDVSVETPEQTAARILEDPDFSTTEEVTRFQPKEDLEWDFLEGCAQPEQPGPQVDIGMPFAVGMEGILWVVVGVVLLMAVVALIRYRGKVADAVARPLPEVRSGRGELEPEPLPTDLVSVARRLWEAGDKDGALALLYRGAVADLVHRGLPIDEGATEGECLRVARRSLKGDERDFFRDLTRAWQERAYAHRDVDDLRGRALLAGWSLHFREVG